MKLVKLLLIIACILALPGAVSAQDVEYRLDLRRDFGYGAGSNVRGNFTNRIHGPEENIASVTFMIDDQVMAEVTQPPFEFKYHTSIYPAGWHDMTAVVTTKDGRDVVTPVVRVNLLSAEQESQSMRNIFIPILVILLVVTLGGMGAQMLFVRRSGLPAPGAPRKYGFKGGAICPRCGRAYPIHFFSINLIGGVVDRCDYCGKVAFVRARSRAELDAAVAAEMRAAGDSEYALPGAHSEMSDEERAKKRLDDSRYLD